MNRFEYVHASSVEAAQRQLSGSGQVVLKAGGIDLLDLLKERLLSPRRLVNLKTIPGLDQIKYDATKGLEIGPMVTLHQLASHALVKAHAPCLAQAAGLVATPQIRNAATLGGNLLQRPRCWYFRSEDFHCLKKGGNQCFAQIGDNRFHAVFGNTTCAIVHPSGAAVALVALNAQLQIHDGTKSRMVPIEGFFTTPETDVTREHSLKPTEIITGIHIPKATATTRSVYLKQKQKESFDWPLADIAVVADVVGGKCSSIRVVLGSAAPIPWRATALEKALVGQPLDAAHIQKALPLVRDKARPMAHNAYKLELFEAVASQALAAIAAQPAAAAPAQAPSTQPTGRKP